jgi:hypothetical protein
VSKIPHPLFRSAPRAKGKPIATIKNTKGFKNEAFIAIARPAKRALHSNVRESIKYVFRRTRLTSKEDDTDWDNHAEFITYSYINGLKTLSL